MCSTKYAAPSSGRPLSMHSAAWLHRREHVGQVRGVQRIVAEHAKSGGSWATTWWTKSGRRHATSSDMVAP